MNNKFPTSANKKEFISCPQDEKILKHFKERFECVFILLHPFIRPENISIELFEPKTWPSKFEIIDNCSAVKWEKVLKFSNLRNLSEVDIALRTRISGLKKEFENKELDLILDNTIEKFDLVPPEEGIIPPLLENKLLNSFQVLGFEKALICDEWGEGMKLHAIDELKSQDLIPSHGCLISEDYNIHLTSHWDSHCTFLCSSKENIEKILATQEYEGFYCSEKTEVYWGLYEI